MTDKPKTWGEMTDAEKVARLVEEIDRNAMYDMPLEERVGKALVALGEIRPEPKRETVVMPVASAGRGWSQYVFQSHATHLITFDTFDGKPDCEKCSTCGTSKHVDMEPIK